MRGRTFPLLALTIFLLTQVAHADSEFHKPTKDHFVWPKKLFPLDPSKFVEVKVDIPRMDDDDDQEPSPTRSVFYIDLNGDGVKEMIVRMGKDGQQSDLGIFQLQGGRWVCIGDFENGCFFCSNWNGYYQIEDGGYGGGGVTSRRLLRFIRGQYREVRDEIYDRGVLNQLRINPNGL